MMNDKESKKTPWVPPNDRELSIRAKLNTGWSSRTNIFTNTTNFLVDHFSTGVTQQRAPASNHTTNSNGSQISDNEYFEIEKVIQRAAQIEQKELNRINKLYQRYNSMNKPQGNGDTECLICNCNFGLLAANPRICNNCLKNVCSSCSIDALSTSKHATIWLCKICAEYRDFLKKSGAWFNKKVPFVIEQPSLLPLSSAGNTPSTNNTPVSSVNKTLSYLNKTTSVSSSTSISSSTNNEPIASTLSQNLNIPNSTANNFVNYNHNNNEITHQAHNDSSPMKHLTNQEDVNIRNNLINNQDDSHLINNSSSTSKQNTKTTNTTNNNNNKTTSGDFDFEHFTREKLKQDSSTKLVESGPSMFSLSSTVSLPPPTSSQSSSNLITSKPTQKSVTDLTTTSTTTTKFSHEQITSSRSMKPINTSSTLSSTNHAVVSQQAAKSISSTSSLKSSTSELGSIQFSVEYVQSLLQLKIHLISASGLPACDSNGLSDPYVKLHLLPGIAKATKLRSKTVYKNLNPKFNETLQYDGINLHDLDEKTLRLTVLDEDKFGFDYIGEYRLPLKSIFLNEVNFFDVDLEPKKQLGDETDTKFRGKINFSLKYSKTANCLYVKINKCRQLLPMDNGKSSDPFVEIALLPFSKENHSKQKFKTSIKWKTLDPEYLEEFKFTNIDLKTLLNKTIEISVWDKDFGKCDFIGVVQLGQQRTGDELKHFFTMVKNPELYHEQWHTLHMHDDMNANEESSTSHND